MVVVPLVAVVAEVADLDDPAALLMADEVDDGVKVQTYKIRLVEIDGNVGGVTDPSMTTA